MSPSSSRRPGRVRRASGSYCWRIASAARSALSPFILLLFVIVFVQQFVDKGTINGRIRSCVFGTYRGGVECFQCILVEVRIFDTVFLQGGCHGCCVFSAVSAILSGGMSSLVAYVYCSSLSMVSEMVLMRRWVSQHEAFIVWESASARCRIVQRVFLSFAVRSRSFASTVAWVR